MILVIDNYDSFTFNLVELIRRHTAVTVVKNDEEDTDLLMQLPLRGLLLSPGPGTPTDSGISASFMTRYKEKIPILGICLGHQLLAQMFGAEIIKGLQPMHGKTSEIHHNGQGLFDGIPDPTTVMRYHSLIVNSDNLPPDLTVTALSADGEIMGMRHKFYNLAGVQFHPESILSIHGEKMIQNWISQLPKKGPTSYL